MSEAGVSSSAAAVSCPMQAPLQPGESFTAWLAAYTGDSSVGSCAQEANDRLLATGSLGAVVSVDSRDFGAWGFVYVTLVAFQPLDASASESSRLLAVIPVGVFLGLHLPSEASSLQQDVLRWLGPSGRKHLGQCVDVSRPVVVARYPSRKDATHGVSVLSTTRYPISFISASEHSTITTRQVHPTHTTPAGEGSSSSAPSTGEEQAKGSATST